MGKVEDHEFDNRMMDVALAMASRGLGRTAPNPAVGAIVVDEQSGEIFGRGWTQPGGRPHAETEALLVAGERARGATIYVTLEPCSHFGKTPPCVSAILDAGIRRVVCGITDPDPRVSGRGLDQLRAKGVEVRRSVRLAETRWVTQGHVLRISERRPFVQLKMALGADGRIARGSDGRIAWVTSKPARAHGALLRSKADAILIGAGTLRDDNPDLTCRLPGLEETSPLRVVLAGQQLPAEDSRILATARRVPVQLIFSDRDLSERAGLMGSDGVKLTTGLSVAGRLWLPDVLEKLAADGVTRLLVEGGPTVWKAFGEAGLVDEVVVYHANARVDVENVLNDVGYYVPGFQFEVTSMRDIGEDRLFKLKPV